MEFFKKLFQKRINRQALHPDDDSIVRKGFDADFFPPSEEIPDTPSKFQLELEITPEGLNIVRYDKEAWMKLQETQLLEMMRVDKLKQDLLGHLTPEMKEEEIFLLDLASDLLEVVIDETNFEGTDQLEYTPSDLLILLTEMLEETYFRYLGDEDEGVAYHKEKIMPLLENIPKLLGPMYQKIGELFKNYYYVIGMTALAHRKGKRKYESPLIAIFSEELAQVEKHANPWGRYRRE